MREKIEPLELSQDFENNLYRNVVHVLVETEKMIPGGQAERVIQVMKALLKQELDKALLTDEELDDCYFNPPTTIANEFLGYEEVNRHIAQAQLDKAKKILES